MVREEPFEPPRLPLREGAFQVRSALLGFSTQRAPCRPVVRSARASPRVLRWRAFLSFTDTVLGTGPGPGLDRDRDTGARLRLAWHRLCGVLAQARILIFPTANFDAHIFIRNRKFWRKF